MPGIAVSSIRWQIHNRLRPATGIIAVERDKSSRVSGACREVSRGIISVRRHLPEGIIVRYDLMIGII
jgi:hypothetical protein